MTTEWKLDGQYFEACNCDLACPCVFTSPPTEGDCTVLVGWHVSQGHFGTVRLDGLNVALAAYSPGHMLETKWQAALYLDANADQSQSEALTMIFGGQAGGHPAMLAGFIGEVLGVASVPIDFQANGKKRSIKIGDVGATEIEALVGQGEQEVTVSNHPVAVSPGYPATVAKSTSLNFTDHGMDWSISEKNGFFAPFTYQSD